MNEQNQNKDMTPAEAAAAEYAAAKKMAEDAKQLSEQVQLGGYAEIGAQTDRAESEDKASTSEEETENKTEEQPKESGTQTQSNEQKQPKKGKSAKAQSRHNRGFTVAAVLSSLSIFLLVALFLGVMLGLVPTQGGAYLYVSGGGPVQGEGYEDLSDMLEAANRSVVVINCTDTTFGGTGFIVTANGYIVTNYHVIEGSKSVYVQLYGIEKQIKAAVVGYSERDDLAVLKINKAGLSPMTFAKQADCRLGETVYAIGTPHNSDFGWSLSRGIISAFDREVGIYDNEGILEKKMYLLQTDAAANHGNSGGPLINARGEVVGIVTLKLSDNENVNFAIPSDGALTLITAIIETGSADGVTSSVSKGRPLIGITGVGVEAETYYENIEQNGQNKIQPVDKEYADANPGKTFYAAATGVYVSKVTPTADAVGKIKVGDIISEVDGTPVLTIYEVMSIINQKDGGDTVKITFWRNGKTYTVSVTLGTAE